ncbi:hypothetical protein LCGC14_1881670 [marine sediment metagenome]|uniref:Uncharacterized protein n=1 Tax=marine sediment metagenome TaxID=412755 RepID=A0A0F9GQD0_9ZZZZ
MTKPITPEILSMPLSVLMGKKNYLNYKHATDNMAFLGKALHSMARNELLAYIGYIGRLYGIIEQPQPQTKDNK